MAYSWINFYSGGGYVLFCYDIRDQRRRQIPMTLDQEIVLFCAFRYALGRMTYVVDSVASEIERSVEKLTTKDLYLYRKEITEALDKHLAGMDMDQTRWIKCRKIIATEMRRRGI